jgi:hypothetical protein
MADRPVMGAVAGARREGVMVRRQLGKSPTRDVIAAMTREKKVASASTAIGGGVQ